MFKDTQIVNPLKKWTTAETVGDFIRVENVNGYYSAVIINPIPMVGAPAAEEFGDIPTGKKMLYAALTLVQSVFTVLKPGDHTFDFDKSRLMALHVRGYLDSRNNWRSQDWSLLEGKLVPSTYNRAPKETSLGDYQREFGFTPSGYAAKHRYMGAILMGSTIVLKPAGYQALAKFAEAVLNAADAEAAQALKLQAFEDAGQGRKARAETFRSGGGIGVNSTKPVIEVLEGAGIEAVQAEALKGKMLHIADGAGHKRNVSATDNNADMLETYFSMGYKIVS